GTCGASIPIKCATVAFEVRRESAMSEYVFDDPATHNFIRKGIERLREEFRGIFSHATIQRFLDEAIASLSGARIKDSTCPLFVSRFARERLLAQVQGQWAKGVPEVLFVCIH